MNDSQTKAWERLRADFVIELPGERHKPDVAAADVDLAAEFGRNAPLIVEIGSGTGESLAAMAATRPQANVLAFEVFEPAVASTMARLNREGVTNVRIMLADGTEGLREFVTAGGLDELWTYFPDPWHKARHHKRRLIGGDFVALVTEKLRVGGRWLIATDWDDYHEWITETLGVSTALRPAPIEPMGPDARPFGRPLTKYERRGIAAGRQIHELAYVKVES